jgi:protein-S-isoprenylcysteine O-methyltransferase Ste14
MSQVDESLLLEHRADSNRAQADGLPKSLVRHPGYVGGILFGLSTPLVLGSLWALILAAIAALSPIVRSIWETKRHSANCTETYWSWMINLGGT